MRDLKAHGKLLVESQRRMKFERGGHPWKCILRRRLEADTGRPPQAVLRFLHVAIKVAEVNDASLVHFVEVDAPAEGVLRYARCTHLPMVYPQRSRAPVRHRRCATHQQPQPSRSISRHPPAPAGETRPRSGFPRCERTRVGPAMDSANRW